MDVSAQAKRANSPLLHLLAVVRPSTDWIMPPTLVGMIFTLSLLIEIRISPGNTLTDARRNVYQLSEHPLAQSQRCFHFPVAVRHAFCNVKMHLICKS